MPKNLSLFGKYLQRHNREVQSGFQKQQIIRPVPAKAYGRPPSASSQTGLYHDEDFNYYTRVARNMSKTRRKLKPNVFLKDFHSSKLNCKLQNVRVTTSALHAMDDAGGFDEYILRTPPEELRSYFAELMRQVMHFYEYHPDLKAWNLPWQVFKTKTAQQDPWYARYLYIYQKEVKEQEKKRQLTKFSPYYLPPSKELHPERQPFVNDTQNLPASNIWWNKSKVIEAAFRSRIALAKSFEQAHADHHLLDGYKVGDGQGGGGLHGTSVRKRSKTHKFHQTRPY